MTRASGVQRPHPRRPPRPRRRRRRRPRTGRARDVRGLGSSPADLTVQTPDERVAAWSTDVRAGVPVLPDLHPDLRSRRCVQTVVAGRDPSIRPLRSTHDRHRRPIRPQARSRPGHRAKAHAPGPQGRPRRSSGWPSGTRPSPSSGPRCGSPAWRRRPRRHAVGQPAVDAVRADVGLEHGVALPVWDALRSDGIADLTTLAQKAAAGSRPVPTCPRAGTRPGPESRRPQGRRRRDQADRPRRRERERLIKRSGDPKQQAVDLPDRRDRRHLRGHPAGPGGRPRGRRRHRGDPLDRAVAARLRARGRRPARATPAPTPRRRTSG